MYSFLLLLAHWLVLSVSARLHSLPEDPYAFPKFGVTFLNHQPLLNETAEHWLKHGLAGGEDEFMGESWQHDDQHLASQRKGIGSGDTLSDTQAPLDTSFSAANYTLEHLRMGPKDSYLCLIPKPSESASSRQEEEPESESTPAKSWSLLVPLSDKCLYHRQGWFTYSYCHNKEIRQFKELAVPLQARIPGSYRPEEDQEWESYTLGLAPRSSEETGADLTVAEQNAQAVNLELARTAGSRYLVQRWGDGTICDKTGKPREVEVQFHCSMVMTDHILFVKETKTCSYVLVIHTPRLCGEPGFKSRRDAVEEAPIRCREVVNALPPAATSPWPKLPAGDTPMKVPKRRPVLPLPRSGSSQGSVGKGKADKSKLDASNGDSSSTKDSAAGSSSEASGKTKEEIYSELVQKTLELLMNNDGGILSAVTGNNRQGASATLNEDGDIVVEIEEGGSNDDGTDASKRITQILKEAGFDVETEFVEVRERKDGTTSGSSKKGGTKNSKDSKSRKNHKKWNFGRFEL
ncbi:hypothetical protein BKA70DRAFT_1247884 [Coprinopsis sp. MPI-PUGE-AT-0042]|nr:hypothetical protein BKA70DRAFT_1247884 [Coprinopsis sp. MPI-PUGE-AT-0042]